MAREEWSGTEATREAPESGVKEKIETLVIDSASAASPPVYVM
jgi:hypothetical protein